MSDDGRLTRVFLRASELRGAQRDAFLDEACVGDPGLRQEVEALLRTDVRTDALRPGEGAPAARPETIDVYRIIRVLGEGGMGTVYLAEQREPVRREVALKVVRHGLDSRTVVTRFEAERQALALMDHPNVARVFDAGTTPDGLPYFVMEYVAGPPITDYSDRNRLTTRQRLELFLQVCEGVEHAHRKAIIHRDLKPSNVLVTEAGGKPAPKIIDFGIAKATAQPLTDKTLHTEVGLFLGTPEYMSPEQADPSVRDVDTRADVYALGVILYELLAGRHPFETGEWRNAGFDEIRRRIREEDPPNPSARVSRAGAEAETSARNRRTDPGSLRRQIRGELDWIVMKAIEKDRGRRYGGVSDLAADIERHLRDEPVLAGPPSATYRVSKFVRRHRVVVTAAAVVAGVLLGALIRERFQSARIERERDRANLEATTAREVTDYLVELFGSADPRRTRGREVTAREILDEGIAKIESQDSLPPTTRARLMTAMGRAYRQLGHLDRSVSLLEGSRGIERAALPADDPAALETRFELAATWAVQWRLEEAEALHREVRQARFRTLGREAAPTLESTEALGTALNDLARSEEATALMGEVIEARRRMLPQDHPDLLRAEGQLATGLARTQRHPEAEALYRRVLEAQRRTLGVDHPETLRVANALGWLLAMMDRNDEAESMLRETLETEERVLGRDHPQTVMCLANLGFVLGENGRREEARPIVREVLAYYRRIAETTNDIKARHEYANRALNCIPEDLRDPVTALRFAEEAAAMTGYRNAKVLNTLALARFDLDRPAEAIRAIEAALSVAPAGARGMRAVLESNLADYKAGRRPKALRGPPVSPTQPNPPRK